MPCSDGGSESGPKMTPLFQDGLRQQLIVDLMAIDGASVFRVNTTQYVPIIERGMDEVANFLRTGTCHDPKGGCPISLCPKGADVKKNTCSPCAG